ncbi:MAG TPA: hypothetical protein VF086_04145 [Propionibacteriaceae bacterium]
MSTRFSVIAGPEVTAVVEWSPEPWWLCGVMTFVVDVTEGIAVVVLVVARAVPGAAPPGVVVVIPGGIRLSETVSQKTWAYMQYFIKASSDRGSQALKKSACNVSGLFIDDNVMVPLVVPGEKRSASVN